MKLPLILVTGASGFIGNEFIEFLAKKKCLVRALSRNKPKCSLNVEWVRGDIRDRNLVEMAVKNVDYVVHLAARKSDERDSWQVNVEGAKNLIDAAIKSKIKKIVNVSTASVKIRNKGTYALTKSRADMLFDASDLQVVTLRPSLVYKNGCEGAFGILMRSASLPIAPIFGPGRVSFWPIHVEDLSQIIWLCLEKRLKDSSYDVGGIESYTTNELIAKLGEYQGKSKTRILHIPTPLGLFFARLLRIIPKTTITESNILGSTQEIDFSPRKILGEINFLPKSVDETLEKRVPLEREAKFILEYVISRPLARQDVIRLAERFVVSQRAMGIDDALPSGIIKFPLLLESFDLASKLFCKGALLQKKLLIAAAIIETDRISSLPLLSKNRSKTEVVTKTASTILRSLIPAVFAAIIVALPGWRKYVGKK